MPPIRIGAGSTEPLTDENLFTQQSKALAKEQEVAYMPNRGLIIFHAQSQFEISVPRFRLTIGLCHIA